MSYAPAPGGTPLRTLSRREAGRARRPVRPRHAALNLAMGTEPASEPATSPGDHGHLGARGFQVSVEDPSPRWDRGDCPRVCVHSVEKMTHLVWKPRPLCVLGGNTQRERGDLTGGPRGNVLECLHRGHGGPRSDEMTRMFRPLHPQPAPWGCTLCAEPGFPWKILLPDVGTFPTLGQCEK